MTSEAATAIVYVGDPWANISAPVEAPVQRVIVIGAGIAGLVAARAPHLAGIDGLAVQPAVHTSPAVFPAVTLASAPR